MLCLSFAYEHILEGEDTKMGSVVNSGIWESALVYSVFVYVFVCGYGGVH